LPLIRLWKYEANSDQVSKHADKKDLYVVIHDKGMFSLSPLLPNLSSIIRLKFAITVYDATKFLDEHPGGEEVLLDMAGTIP